MNSIGIFHAQCRHIVDKQLFLAARTITIIHLLRNLLHHLLGRLVHTIVSSDRKLEAVVEVVRH